MFRRDRSYLQFPSGDDKIESELFQQPPTLPTSLTISEFTAAPPFPTQTARSHILQGHQGLAALAAL